MRVRDRGREEKDGEIGYLKAVTCGYYSFGGQQSYRVLWVSFEKRRACWVAWPYLDWLLYLNLCLS